MDFVVSRSLLVEKTPNGRFAEEKRILADHFPGFTLRQTEGGSGAATGRLWTFVGRSYDLRVVLPESYPNELPDIVPDGWIAEKNPHIYTNGNLCVMKSDQWRPFMSVAFLVGKSALWLHKYEIYRDKKIWPGAEQHDHSLTYKVWKRINKLG